jgi:hypothetical protein
MAQVTECLSSKHEALSSNPCTAKKREKECLNVLIFVEKKARRLYFLKIKNYFHSVHTLSGEK